MIDDKELEKLADLWGHEHPEDAPFKNYRGSAKMGYAAGYRAAEAKALERNERLRAALEFCARADNPGRDKIIKARAALKDDGNETV